VTATVLIKLLQAASALHILGRFLATVLTSFLARRRLLLASGLALRNTLRVMVALYDAIIVGGGPGGSTAGAALARAGKNVLILERERFPRFHVGESLIP